jgi:hypothetical protein
MSSSEAITRSCPVCMDCGADLSTADYRPAYTDRHSDPRIKCVPCDSAAWARMDAIAATLPANAAYSNGWD